MLRSSPRASALPSARRRCRRSTERCWGAPPQLPSWPSVQPAAGDGAAHAARQSRGGGAVEDRHRLGLVDSGRAASAWAWRRRGSAGRAGVRGAGLGGAGLGWRLGAGTRRRCWRPARPIRPPCLPPVENPSFGRIRKATRPTARAAAPTARMGPRRRRRDSATARWTPWRVEVSGTRSNSSRAYLVMVKTTSLLISDECPRWLSRGNPRVRLCFTRLSPSGGQCAHVGVTYVVYAISSPAWDRGPAHPRYR